MTDTFLSNVVVVEIGDRHAVGACGSLLAELGATVVLIEPSGLAASKGTKWTYRPAVAAGKRSFAIDVASASDIALVRQAIARADAVVVSSDTAPAWAREVVRGAEASTIVCDVTAFGRSGPLANRNYSDALVQAMTGVLDTTGDPEGPPALTQIPVIEWASGLYALAGILAALRARDRYGFAQAVEIALYDCAISALTTFLPGYFVGKEPQRMGNHHPSMSPWNAYRAGDGWVMLCAGSDDMWRRICEVIGRPELASDGRYATPTHRVKINLEIDHIIEEWTRGHSVAECVERFAAAALPCGPIFTIAELFSDTNLVHRNMVRLVRDPVSGEELRLAGPVFRGMAATGRAADFIARPDADRSWLEQYAARPAAESPKTAASGAHRPLVGLRVIEIGTYTTAPFCARHLAALGADVVKVESPAGDPARVLPPLRDGQGYFFTMSNSDKRGVTLDLRTAEGKTMLRKLLRKADVLVDNLKPGSLARLGFGRDDLARVNPRLIHCAVSGFGADSPLADRQGMDTTIQGMAGIMDLTRVAGMPYKTGISIADLTGGQLGLAAILAGLAYRDRTGGGLALDLSMQDAGAWLTRTAWNAQFEDHQANAFIECEDGYVVAEAASEAVECAAEATISRNGASRELRAYGMTRKQLVEQLAKRGILSAPVLRVTEAAQHPQSVARQLIITGKTDDGVEWPLLSCPIRLSRTPALVQRAMRAPNADAATVLRDWLDED